MTAHHPLSPELLTQVTAWAADDVDPQETQQLRALITSAAHDPKAAAELQDAFRGPLAFGTAGLRGPIGPGPARMNRIVVRRAAAGIARYLLERHRDGCAVVIGYDARHGSATFAADSAAIMSAAGIRALVLPRPLPTPVLAYAIRTLGCAAGIMVTASHNPARDNGYKVYLGDGSQITPPADEQISAAIADVSRYPASDLPLSDDWITLGDDIEASYVDAVVSAVIDSDATPRDITRLADRSVRIVYTPMHGVGGTVFETVLTRAGFAPPLRVSEQFTPNPDFPTVAFPNPEEPGAMDLALALAERERPAIVIAHDPDADRCAVAVPDETGHWRMLSGDDVGALLAWWSIHRTLPGDVLAESLVSCSLLEHIAAAAGMRYARTLTGFKWIGKIENLRFGYEEALGYCVNPSMVRDKDGIAAGLAMLTLVDDLQASHRTVLDVLDDLAREHGVFRTAQVSVRVADVDRIPGILRALRSDPPTHIADLAVERLVDLEMGWNGLPPTDGLLFDLGGGNRVIIRPSGTEPKVKCYLQAVEPVRSNDLATSRTIADTRIQALREAVARWLNP